MSDGYIWGRGTSDDAAVDLHPLLKRAHQVSADRTEQYGDWRSTAARINPDDLGEYPRNMIEVKLARDPELRRADTIDVVNYAGMLYELEHDDSVTVSLFKLGISEELRSKAKAMLDRMPQIGD